MPAHEPIGRTDDACPSCLASLAQRPKQKTMCPACGGAIFVRTRPDDDVIVLLNDSGRRGIEAAKRAKTWIAKPLSAEETAAQLTRLAEHRNRSLASVRDLVGHGIDVELVILTAPHACPAALAQIDRTYTVDDLPPLPMADCSLSPKCSCVVSPRVIAKELPPSTEAVEQAYDEALSRLDPRSAHRVNAMVETTIRGFGIEPKSSRWSMPPEPGALPEVALPAVAAPKAKAASGRSWLGRLLRHR